MFWSLLTKILVGVLTDLLVGLLVKWILAAGAALFGGERGFQQPGIA